MKHSNLIAAAVTAGLLSTSCMGLGVSTDLGVGYNYPDDPYLYGSGPIVTVNPYPGLDYGLGLGGWGWSPGWSVPSTPPPPKPRPNPQPQKPQNPGNIAPPQHPIPSPPSGSGNTGFRPGASSMPGPSNPIPREFGRH